MNQRRPLTIPEQIADSITTSLLQGNFDPSTPLREVELAAQFKVSRAPIREALRILENRGVVQIVPQRGACVTQLSTTEIQNLFEIRTALAGLMASELCKNLAHSLIASLQERIAKMSELIEFDDEVAEFTSLSWHCSQLTFAHCPNTQLAEIFGWMSNQTIRYTRAGMSNLSHRRSLVARWQEFVSALEDSHTTRSKLALELLIKEWQASALSALEQGSAR